MENEKRYAKTILYGFTGRDHAYSVLGYYWAFDDEDDPASLRRAARCLVREKPAIMEVWAVTGRPGLKKDYEDSVKKGMSDKVDFHTMVEAEGIRIPIDD